MFTNSIGAAETPELSIMGPVKIYEDVTLFGKTNINPFFVASKCNGISLQVFSSQGQVTPSVGRGGGAVAGIFKVDFPSAHPKGNKYIVHSVVESTFTPSVRITEVNELFVRVESLNGTSYVNPMFSVTSLA